MSQRRRQGIRLIITIAMVAFMATFFLLAASSTSLGLIVKNILIGSIVPSLVMLVSDLYFLIRYRD